MIDRGLGLVLVTGASRGTGALVATSLARVGYDIGVGFREKVPRAERVAAQVAQTGRRAVLLEGDISTPDGRTQVVSAAAAASERISGLVLNASGGLEPGQDPGYPMRINCEAQVELVKLCAPHLAGGGRIVYVTSHFAHEYPDLELPVSGYEPIAAGKNAGERALLSLSPDLVEAGIRLVVATGDMLEDSSMMRLLERADPGLMDRRRSVIGRLPTTREFAETVASGITDPDLAPGAAVGRREPRR